ncbi:MAG: hypothetical protein ABW001_14605 [Mycobacterium sp.]
MIEFCAARDVLADVEVVRAEQIHNALDRLAANDVRFRLGIDRTSA